MSKEICNQYLDSDNNIDAMVIVCKCCTDLNITPYPVTPSLACDILEIVVKAHTLKGCNDEKVD